MSHLTSDETRACPPEALARQEVHDSVLCDVWEAMARIYPAGGQRPITDLGFLAASTDGAALRVLLRVPVAHCDDSGSSELLANIARVLSALPCRRDVHLSLKVYCPTSLVHDDARSTPAEGTPARSGNIPAHGAGMDSVPDAHARCLRQATTGLRERGWQLGGVEQHPFDASGLADADHAATVRVIVRARVDPEADRPQPGRASWITEPGRGARF